MKNSFRILVFAVCIGGSLILAAARARAQVPPGRQTVKTHLPAARKTDVPPRAQGRLAASQRLNLAIGLPLRNREALTNLLQRIYDPACADYHHYLTTAEFTEQFGPAEPDYQAVIAFAKANGLTVKATHPNRAVLDVSGAVADIERALHVKFQVYQHPTENRTFFAPDTEPSLDLTTPILGISGLDNYAPPRPRLKA